MRALVTGGSGFIGANLVRRLLRDGHETHLVLRTEANKWRLDGILNDVFQHRGAIENRDFIELLVDQVKPDWIFHCAAHGAYSFQGDTATMIETNLLGLAHLLDAARRHGVSAFINSGSSSEYGEYDHPPGEDEPTHPASFYAVTKAAATNLCNQMSGQHGVPTTTLRLYSAYGPFEEPSRLMPQLVTHALRGEWIPFAAPWTVRDFIYIDDVIDAYILAAQNQPAKTGRIYNVGTGNQTDFSELASIAKAVFGLQNEPVFGSYGNRDWDIPTWVADPTQIKASLSWAAKTTLADGLRQMGTWIAEHSKQYALVQAARES